MDCQMLTSPDTLQVLLTGFTCMVWSMALESPILGRPDLTLLLRFLQPEHYCTVINCIFTFCATNVFGSFCSIIPSSNSERINYQIRLHSTFNCVVFRSPTGWSYTQYVSTPTTIKLPITASASHGLNCFSHVIYLP